MGIFLILFFVLFLCAVLEVTFCYVCNSSRDDADSIENILSLALVNPRSGASSDGGVSWDSLASSCWDEVPPSKTLLTPVQCNPYGVNFKLKTEYSVRQAIAAQEASRRNNNWMPPPWAIVALFVLGFNEFMALLSCLEFYQYPPNSYQPLSTFFGN